MTREEEAAGRGWLGSLGAVIGALALALVIQWVLVKPYRIPTPSMVPTLQVGERVLVDRLTNRFGDPQLGEIIVFTPPAGADDPERPCGTERAPGTACLQERDGRASTTYIKRVIGLPGDRLEVRDGHVWRNGKALREPYAEPCSDEVCNIEPFEVPAGRYFMMGDNRGDSSDSRYWGPVPRDYVIGQAFATYWPLKRIGGL